MFSYYYYYVIKLIPAQLTACINYHQTLYLCQDYLGNIEAQD